MFNNLDVSLRDKAEYLRGLMIVLKIGNKLSNRERSYLLSKNEWLLNVCLTNQIKYEWFVYCNNIFYSDNIPKSNYLLTA